MYETVPARAFAFLLVFSQKLLNSKIEVTQDT